MVSLNSIAWGGAYNPIVVIDEAEIAFEQIQSYRPDLLLPVTDDAETSAFIAKFPHLKTPFELREFLDNKSISVLDIRHAVANIKDSAGFSSVKNRLLAISHDEGHALKDLLLVSLGRHPFADATNLDFASSIVSEGLGDAVTIDPNAPLQKLLLEGMNPLRVTRQNIYPSHRRGRSSRGVYLGGASSFLDLVAFWNIRASFKPVIFFDNTFHDRLKDWKDFALEIYREYQVSASEWNGNFCVYARDHQLLESASTLFPDTTLLLRRVGRHFWSSTNLDPPAACIANANVLGAVFEQFGKLNASFELNDRPAVTGWELSTQKYIVTIKPIYYPEADQGLTFSPLCLPELNEFYSRECLGHSPSDVRSEPDGLGFVIDAGDSNLSFNAIRGNEMVNRLFSHYGLSSETSSAGRIAKQIQLQMGRVQECRGFKVAGVRRLLKGAIPVLVTLQQLDTCEPILGRAFKLYATKFKERSGQINCESDFVYVAPKGRDDRIEIVLAECKNRKAIERQDLENLTKVAAMFPADRFSTYILLSKFADFTTDELDMIRSFQGQHRKHLILWSARELEPYDVYEKTKDRFSYDRYDKSLSGLAKASHAMYLDPNLTHPSMVPA